MYEWIKNLKVGDKVFVCWRMGQSLREVEKITPKGNIKVGGTLFNANGSERGGDVWSKSYLAEATPEAINSFKEKLIIQKAKKLMSATKELTLEQANKIIDILELQKADNQK